MTDWKITDDDDDREELADELGMGWSALRENDTDSAVQCVIKRSHQLKHLAVM